VDKPGDSIENEYLRVSAAREDGALAVLDKRSGRHFTGLNRFVDGGEAGDEYTYCPPAEDHFVDRPDGPPTVRVIEDGPARYTLEVASVYALPARLTEDRQRRSPELRECAIVTRVSLYPGVPRVEIETEVDNNAEDHRLRVHFPTGIKSSSSFAEQHFGVVERPVALPEYDGTWFEAPVGTYPQKTFAFITDGRAGLMLANRGLPEYEAIEGPDGAVTLALTLLRCVSWLSRNDLRTRPVGHAGPPMYTPGAQMPGRWRFHYAVIPFEGDWLPAAREAHLFARPLRALRASRGTGALPPASSLASIDQQAFVLSALKPAEEGAAVVLRVYNIAGEPREGVVRLHLPFRAVERVDLNEERPEPLSANDGGVRLLLQRNEIATLRFTL
jgi:alpha-mannosidase